MGETVRHDQLMALMRGAGVGRHGAAGAPEGYGRAGTGACASVGFSAAPKPMGLLGYLGAQ